MNRMPGIRFWMAGAEVEVKVEVKVENAPQMAQIIQ
jgi:hypothetical protein